MASKKRNANTLFELIKQQQEAGKTAKLPEQFRVPEWMDGDEAARAGMDDTPAPPAPETVEPDVEDAPDVDATEPEAPEAVEIETEEAEAVAEEPVEPETTGPVPEPEPEPVAVDEPTPEPEPEPEPVAVDEPAPEPEPALMMMETETSVSAQPAPKTEMLPPAIKMAGVALLMLLAFWLGRMTVGQSETPAEEEGKPAVQQPDSTEPQPAKTASGRTLGHYYLVFDIMRTASDYDKAEANRMASYFASFGFSADVKRWRNPDTGKQYWAVWSLDGFETGGDDESRAFRRKAEKRREAYYQETHGVTTVQLPSMVFVDAQRLDD